MKQVWERLPWQLVTAAVLLLAALFFRFALLGYKATAAVLVGLAAFFVLLFLLRQQVVLRCVLWGLLAAGVLAVAVAEVPVLVASGGDEQAEAPYLVVLGAGVNGTVPSSALLDRLKAAKDYLDAHPDTVAIVSGGQGPGEDITEAQAMSDWLVAHGVDSTRLLTEDKATSTEENLSFSFDIIRARGDDPADGVAIVSSEYHLYRAKQMAKKQGAMPYGVAAHTSIWPLRINYFLREAFAVWHLWVFG